MTHLKDIRRVTRKRYSAEEKIRIVLEGLRGEYLIAELCRREGIAQSLSYSWSKEFLEAGKTCYLRSFDGDFLAHHMVTKHESFHEDLERHHQTSQSSDRSVGIFLGAILTAMAVYRIAVSGNLSTSTFILAGLGGALIGLGFLAPRYLAPLSDLWMQIGAVLARIVNPLVLAILFYGIFTPSGLILRLMGKDILRLKFDTSANDYWIRREPAGPAPETMRNQF